MRRSSLFLLLLTLAAVVLGAWMALDGLHARLFGDFIRLEGRLGPWVAWPRALGLDPLALAWPLLVVGTGWFGAVCGLWIGLSWARPAAFVLAGLSLLYLGPGTVLALIVLGCLLLDRGGSPAGPAD